MAKATKKSWNKALVPVTSTVQDVIRNLDESALQIAMVVGSDGVLLGTVTDGDVRRALLRGKDMNSTVESIMYSSPMVVTPEISRDIVLNLMRINKIHQLPIIDLNRRVVGLHIWNDIVAPASRDNPFVVMAGGFGKRLRPYTEDVPKPMVEVAGRPMLEHIVERAKREGFTRFVFSLHYLGEVIEEYFGDGSRFGVHVDYVREEQPLGTAGALTLLDPAPEMAYVVTNGDVLTDIHYGEMLDFHLHHGADATMAVRQHEWQHPFGVVRTKGLEIVGFEEKPVHRSHVNAGIYVLNPGVIDELERGVACDMPALFEKLKQAGRKVIAYPMHEPWLDVGRPEDLRQANSAEAGKQWLGVCRSLLSYLPGAAVCDFHARISVCSVASR